MTPLVRTYFEKKKSYIQVNTVIGVGVPEPGELLSSTFSILPYDLLSV